MLSDQLPAGFIPPQMSDATGLVGITPDLQISTLLWAYCHGIFPWNDHPVRWYAPLQRAIFELDRVKLPSNLNKIIRQAAFRITYDKAFAQVIAGCAQAHQEEGTWITPRFERAYTMLHQQGLAHSVEVWQHEQLVGGLYGVQINRFFAGESMFHRVSNASKVAFLGLLRQLQCQDITWFDAQVLNGHTQRLGAIEITRTLYLRRLVDAVGQTFTLPPGPWRQDPH